MSRRFYAIAAGVLAAACLGVAAYAQEPAPPSFATTKVDGTHNVDVFRPQAVVTCVDEIEKVSRDCGIWGRGT
jgi:hypothetical protein